MSGYSGTPLPKKLGLKDGQAVAWINRPATQETLGASRAFSRAEQTTPDKIQPPFDVIHFFTDSRAEFEDALPKLLAALHKDGMIWVSWPKKASKIPTDMSEDVIRDLALTGSLVDVKVCAVDDIWSGLKLVIRKTLRDQHPVQN